MNKKKNMWRTLLLLVVTLVWVCAVSVSAESDDNSLYSLGILTEGVEVSPEFSYDRVEYDVKVPAGTKKLELEPVTSNEHAWIVDITGTEIVNGETTVAITVSAQNGSQYTYYLYVTSDGPAQEIAPMTEAPQTEKQTETEIETEPETEDPRYVKVDRNSLQEAENTISALKTETGNYRSKVGLLTKILYGMIAFSVILLFIVINLILKKRDLKKELEAYRGYGYPQDYAGSYAETQTYGDAYPEYAQEQQYQEQQYQAQAYEQPMQQEFQNMPEFQPEKPAKTQKVKKVKKVKDDPNTVPKPAKAKKQAKKMPEYQEPAQPYEYQEPDTKEKKDDVEFTMIDL